MMTSSAPVRGRVQYSSKGRLFLDANLQQSNKENDYVKVRFSALFLKAEQQKKLKEK